MTRLVPVWLTAVALLMLAGWLSPAAYGQATPASDAEGFRLVARVLPAEWATLPAETGTPVAEDGLLSGAALVEALRGGGYVIYFRHARTDFSMPDTDRSDLTNCATQRNLSDEGRADARAMGEAIRALEIPIGEVLASEYCRTRETAELAFGRVTPTRDLTSRSTLSTDEERAARIEALRVLLSTPPEPGIYTVQVGHQFNLGDATGISIAEGEAAIFLPLGAPPTPVATPEAPEYAEPEY